MLNIQKGARHSRRNVTMWTYMFPNPSLSIFHPKTQQVQQHERYATGTSSKQSNIPPIHSGSLTRTRWPLSFSPALPFIEPCNSSLNSDSNSLPRGLPIKVSETPIDSTKSILSYASDVEEDDNNHHVSPFIRTSFRWKGFIEQTKHEQTKHDAGDRDADQPEQESNVHRMREPFLADDQIWKRANGGWNRSSNDAFKQDGQREEIGHALQLSKSEHDNSHPDLSPHGIMTYFYDVIEIMYHPSLKDDIMKKLIAENLNSFRFLLNQAENLTSFRFLLNQAENLDLLADDPSHKATKGQGTTTREDNLNPCLE
ncbi:hypothetical protein IEQ34_008869 [Dendrobium chrysotoxum]|uniref:Uncharacterized protein n=1 Tax=Dendrobium chrysotoxum TaxID=161865 RepID=A0AAV7GHR3_DENCH|nr:hypothetical protein IEQ34_008869 [Dendrobium chrysotoxum]